MIYSLYHWVFKKIELKKIGFKNIERQMEIDYPM